MRVSDQLTKSEFTRQRRRITRAIEHWAKALDLDHWNGTVTFFNEREPESLGTGAAHGGVAAEVATVWAYERYEMNVWAPIFAEMTDDELSEAILHEMCHVLIEPATKQSRNKTDQALNEMVTTRLTRAIWNASQH